GRLARAMDLGAVVLERDGFAKITSTRFGMIAFDEGISLEEVPPSVLIDRAALHVDLSHPAETPENDFLPSRDDISRTREIAAFVKLSHEIRPAIVEAGCALGIVSANILLQTVWVARVIATLDGRTAVSEQDAGTSVRLVMAPRARCCPETAAPDPAEP